MDSAALQPLQDLFGQVDILMLIFVRVTAFFILLPVISMRNIPRTSLVFLSLTISVLLYSSGLITIAPYVDTTLGYVYIILREFIAGLTMGFVLFAVFNLIFFTGQIIDYMIGFSMVNVLDPLTQIQVPIVGNLYFLVMSVLLVVTGGLHMFIEVFFHSYTVLPIGAAWVVGNEYIAWYIPTLLGEFINLAVRIALPLMGAIMIVDAALGILIRTVPQINVFVVGIPIKICIGLLLLITMITPSLGLSFRLVFETAYTALEEIIHALGRQR
jgi:flagellar biosynthetic protein FliR